MGYLLGRGEKNEKADEAVLQRFEISVCLGEHVESEYHVRSYEEQKEPEHVQYWRESLEYLPNESSYTAAVFRVDQKYRSQRPGDSDVGRLTHQHRRSFHEHNRQCYAL